MRPRLNSFLLFIIILLYFPNKSVSQTDISAAGGNGQSNTGSFSYTLGQSFYSNFSSEHGSLNEGVQQPEEFFIVSSIEASFLKSSINVYPNPVSSDLIITGDESQIFKQFEIYNLSGQLLRRGNISYASPINVSTINSGVYILKIYDKYFTSTQFVIIKI